MNKKLISAAAVFVFGASLAVAAPNDGDGFRGGRHRGAKAEHLARKLNLSDAQRDQMRDIRKGFREENRAFFESFHQTFRDYRAAKKAGDTAKADELKAQLESQRAQMKLLHDTLDGKISAVLTPEQNAQWSAMKAERAARRQNRQER